MNTKKKVVRFYMLILSGALCFFTETVHSFQISFSSYSSGLNLPVAITNAGDGSGRLFVVEQQGTVRIIKNGVLQAIPFLNISNRVFSGGERGLLGIAFPPHYVTKGYFYVNYTRISDGATTISRFRITSNPDIADPNSEEILLIIAQSFANHNGGQIAFSPKDGYLYIGMGDGGSGGDPLNLAQDPTSLLGKILRIDVEAGVSPYAIPPDNPLINDVRSEIWSLGLRNPWRFSFDRLTHDLYIGDVGQGLREEINFQPASSAGGENYGWRILEGSLCFNPPVGCVPPQNYSPPVAEYDHNQGCSVTGGVIYRGNRYPFMQGTYLYGDFCTGRIWNLKRSGQNWQNSLLIDTPFQISTFGEDESGEIFVADYGTGRILKIIFSDRTVDFDGDSKSDILWQHSPSGTVAIWIMDGTTVSSVGVPGAISADWLIKGIGDFDGNSKSDILWQHPTTGTVATWMMDRTNVSSIGVLGAVSSDWQIKGIGDFNGNSKADILWQHPTTGTVVIWFMDGTTLSSVGAIGAVPIGWEIKGVGDFDADGKSDILWIQPALGTVAIWMMNGIAIASVGVAGAVPSDWAIKGVGDFNADGKSDVLWFHPATGTVAIWMMNGTTLSSVGVAGAVPIGWEIKGTGDFNGDGKSDILWFHPATGTVAIWMMNGMNISSVGVAGAVPTGWEIKH